MPLSRKLILVALIVHFCSLFLLYKDQGLVLLRISRNLKMPKTNSHD